MFVLFFMFTLSCFRLLKPLYMFFRFTSESVSRFLFSFWFGIICVFCFRFSSISNHNNNKMNENETEISNAIRFSFRTFKTLTGRADEWSESDKIRISHHWMLLQQFIRTLSIYFLLSQPVGSGTYMNGTDIAGN